MENIVDFIDKLLKADEIDCWGYCDFEQLSSELIECRAKNRLPENAQSVICMLFPYYSGEKQRNISYYACVKDYHSVLNQKLDNICKKLKEKLPDYKFSFFADNSPLKEVDLAVRCNLGVRGDNGLLINEKYGSFVFIGEIVTDLTLPDKPEVEKNNTCLHCQKCIRSCPGKALSENSFNRDLCASHISQKKGDLSDWEISILKKSSLVWGCDICQEVCPLNKNISFTRIKEFNEQIIPIIKKGDYEILQNRAFKWRKAQVINRNIMISEELNSETEGKRCDE